MSTAVNIGIFGRRNVGKSSLINTLAGQEVAIVSDHPGTTTDPVRKRMEIFGLGPCVLIDTAGIDDDGEVGKKRVSKTKELIGQIDMAVILYTANDFGSYEQELARLLQKAEVPFLLLHNQSDIIPMSEEQSRALSQKYGTEVIEFTCDPFSDEESSALMEKFFEAVSKTVKPYVSKTILEGLVRKGDEIWLICPVDSEAPQGRLILPQVMALRDVLDHDGRAVVMKPEQLQEMLSSPHARPALVVTDSQAFGFVNKVLPEDYPLTSFSILLARSKGPFEAYMKGAACVEKLKDGDRILIMESCNHHSSCDDIGRVKIPALLKKHTGKNLEFEIIPNLEKTGDFSRFAMVVQCGACMITRRQLMSRLKEPMEKNIPIINYGMLLAYLNGILERSVSVFKDAR